MIHHHSFTDIHVYSCTQVVIKCACVCAFELHPLISFLIASFASSSGVCMCVLLQHAWVYIYMYAAYVQAAAATCMYACMVYIQHTSICRCSAYLCYTSRACMRAACWTLLLLYAAAAAVYSSCCQLTLEMIEYNTFTLTCIAWMRAMHAGRV